MKNFKTQDFSYKDRHSLSKSDDIMSGGGMLIGGFIDMGSGGPGHSISENKHPIFNLNSNIYNGTDNGGGATGLFSFASTNLPNNQELFNFGKSNGNLNSQKEENNPRFKDINHIYNGETEQSLSSYYSQNKLSDTIKRRKYWGEPIDCSSVK